MSEEVNDILLLDQALEDRFIKSLLAHEKMVKVVKGVLEPENFSTQLKHRIYTTVLWHYSEYKTLPDADILQYEFKELYGSKQEILLHRYLAKLSDIPVPEWSWIITKLDNWVKSIRLHKKLFEAAEAIKDGKLEIAQEMIIRTIRSSGLIATTGKNDINLSLDEIQELVEDDNLFCCPTRIYALDDVIRGLFRKELLVVMAPLNTGKSFGIIHLAVSALLSGKHVLYLTLEMSKERVMQRILQNVSGAVKNRYADEVERQVELWSEDWTTKELVKVPTLLNIKTVAKHLNTLSRYGGKFSCKGYPSGTCSVNDIEREILLFDTYFNKLPDVIFIDGLLDIKHSGGGDERKRQAGLAEITTVLRRYSDEYNCSVVVSHQSNRTGLTAEIVTAEHTGQALEIVQIADTAISLNQTRAEVILGKMRIYVLRARNQKKWQMIEIWQNLDIGQFAQASKIMTDEEVYGDEEEEEGSVRDRLKQRRFNRG